MAPNTNHNWTAADDAYLTDWHGRVPLSDIAAELGRTLEGVMARRLTLGLDMPHEWPTIYTSTQLARAFGIGNESARGLLRTSPKMMTFWRRKWRMTTTHDRRMPSDKFWRTNEPMQAIYRSRLHRWLRNPLNHWCVKRMARPLPSQELEEIVTYAERRWDDEWMTTAEAGQMVCVECDTVSNWILSGLLPSAVRYGNWYVLRNEVQKLVQEKGL
ncbi:MAG: hypothetical protein KDD89_04350 [Anaerolineales bacterium]|nr:hypothetical protein [Anaerolineales bacterium]